MKSTMLGVLVFAALSGAAALAQSGCQPVNVVNNFNYQCWCGAYVNTNKCQGYPGSGCNPVASWAACCGGQVANAAGCWPGSLRGNDAISKPILEEKTLYAKNTPAVGCSNPEVFKRWLASKLK